MYNHYLQGEDGGFTRVHIPNPPPCPSPEAPSPPEECSEATGGDGGRFLAKLLGKLKLQNVDTGDLLLLLLLFFLFEEKGDDELLIALGLLLIL